MKKVISLLAIFLLLVGCSPAIGAQGGFKQVSPREAATIMQTETGYVIVDVRTPAEFADRHIPNAVNIPNETIDENVVKLLPDKEQKLLVYCRSGNRSKQAARKLVNLGYTNVIEFGGINDWHGETVKVK